MKTDTPKYINKKSLDHFIGNALQEDLGNGDHSSLSCIPKNKKNSAKLLVKENCTIAGVDLAQIIFNYFDPSLEFEKLIPDGQNVKKNEIVFFVHGNSRSILSTERLVLNCMQRMSGIATKTNQLVGLLSDTNTKLLDTRKTTPNFRLCEKWAVVIGGGMNHRFGLYDMIMLKDNHIDYCGSIEKAVNNTKKYLKANKLNLKIEVETRNLKEVEEAIKAKVDRIMLDNMSVEQMKKAVELINGVSETEASGGITEKELLAIAKTGVNYISMGALTHSANNIDLSLKAV